MKYSLTCLDQCMCLLQFQHDPLSSHLEPKETEKETKESNKVLLLRIHNSAAMQIVLFRFKKAKSYLRLLQHVSVVIHVKPKSWTVKTPMPILRSILSYTQEVKWCGPYRLGQCRLHYGWHITLQYYNCSLKHYTCIQKIQQVRFLQHFFPKNTYTKWFYPILVEGPIMTEGPTTVLDPIWTSAPNIAFSWTTAPNSTRAEESITAELWYVPPPFLHLRNPFSTTLPPPRLDSSLLQFAKTTGRSIINN